MKAKVSKMKAQLDVHTHTIASGHAYATITEMARAASEKGLKLLGITEHAKGIPGTCDNFYFVNLKALPREMFGVEMMFGSEINILDYEGHLSLEQKYIDCLDIRIAGIHRFCYRYGSKEQNTAAVLSAIKNPEIDIISHPDNDNSPLDYDILVPASKKYNTLLEINNNSMKSKTRKNVYQNCCRILSLCKQYNCPVIMGSDAHFTDAVGGFELAEQALYQTQFPDELVMNFHIDKFKAYIAENRRARQH